MSLQSGWSILVSRAEQRPVQTTPGRTTRRNRFRGRLAFRKPSLFLSGHGGNMSISRSRVRGHARFLTLPGPRSVRGQVGLCLGSGVTCPPRSEQRAIEEARVGMGLRCAPVGLACGMKLPSAGVRREGALRC